MTSARPSDSQLCPHGVDPRMAHCCVCADPAFHAAQQPTATNLTITIGGETMARSSKNEVSFRALLDDLVACALIEGNAADRASGGFEREQATKAAKERVLAAYEGRSSETGCNHPANTGVKAWKCDVCGVLRESPALGPIARSQRDTSDTLCQWHGRLWVEACVGCESAQAAIRAALKAVAPRKSCPCGDRDCPGEEYYNRDDSSGSESE